MGYLTHGTEAGGKTYDLLPCPFCGGEAVFQEYTGRAVEVALANRCDVPAMIKCERCGAMVSFNTGTRSTRRDAADAWNRRVERTCHYVYDKEICAWRCSECGGLEPVGYHVRYCPDCGARIAEEVNE